MSIRRSVVLPAPEPPKMTVVSAARSDEADIAQYFLGAEAFGKVLDDDVLVVREGATGSLT